MNDFFQSGDITTLHRLGSLDLEKLEAELCVFGQENPIALVLPCLYSELEGDALPRILNVIKEISYLSEIVVSLGNASSAEFSRACEFFSVLPQETRLIWPRQPMLGPFLQFRERRGVRAHHSGKGRAVWI